MLRPLTAAIMLGLVTCGSASLADPQSDRSLTGEDKSPLNDKSQPIDEPPRVYVQIIVKACRASETPLEPINQGKVYDDERPRSVEDRKVALLELGCIDVPIPMDFLAAESLTPTACQGHAGYLAAMQFLQQRQDLAEFSAVGAWQCIVTDHKVIGAATM